LLHPQHEEGMGTIPAPAGAAAGAVKCSSCPPPTHTPSFSRQHCSFCMSTTNLLSSSVTSHLPRASSPAALVAAARPCGGGGPRQHRFGWRRPTPPLHGSFSPGPAAPTRTPAVLLFSPPLPSLLRPRARAQRRLPLGGDSQADPGARGRQRPELDGVGEPAAAGVPATVVFSLLLSMGDFCRCWRYVAMPCWHAMSTD
jgi:hypothetical protein